MNEDEIAALQTALRTAKAARARNAVKAGTGGARKRR
jgi:hypothetical protein